MEALVFFFKNVPTSSHHSEMFRQHHQQTNKHTAADLLEGWSFYHKLCNVSFTCALADASRSAWNILPLSCHLQSTINPLTFTHMQTHTHIFFVHHYALFRGSLTLFIIMHYLGVPFLGQCALTWSPVPVSPSCAFLALNDAHQIVPITLNCTCLSVCSLHPPDCKLCKGPDPVQAIYEHNLKTTGTQAKMTFF